MHHPFELELSELETLNLEMPEITSEEAQKVIGGAISITTMATGEEGSEDPTTMATGEEGGGEFFLTLAF